MTIHEGEIFDAARPCMFCRTLEGKPLTVPPHPLLALVDTDFRGNHFHCTNCKLGWMVELDTEEPWRAAARPAPDLPPAPARAVTHPRPSTVVTRHAEPLHLRIVGR